MFDLVSDVWRQGTSTGSVAKGRLFLRCWKDSPLCGARMRLTPLRYSELAARVVARHDEAAWLAHRSASRSLACYPAPHGLVSIRDGRNSTCGRNRLRGRLVEVGEGLTSLVWPCVGAAISHSSLRRIFAVHWLSAWRRCPASWRALPNGAPRRSGLGRLSQASPAGRLRGGGIPPP